MPTIIQERGFRVVIHLHDHFPAHVHVRKAGQQARIGLSPVEIWDSEFTPGDTRRALSIVEANRDILLSEWRSIHGEG